MDTMTWSKKKICLIALLVVCGSIIWLGGEPEDPDGSDEQSCDGDGGYKPCDRSPSSSWFGPTSCCSVNPIIRQQITRMKSSFCCIPNIGSVYTGATVATTRDTVSYKHPHGLPTSELTNKPQLVIMPTDHVAAGKNWHFTGVGKLVIKLFYPAQISGFSIIHPPLCLIPDGYETSAPKDFSVMGLNTLDDANPFLFGNFTYARTSSSQTFPVQFCSSDKFSFIEFTFMSNYGNLNYTALYKVEIHGDIGPPPFQVAKIL